MNNSLLAPEKMIKDTLWKIEYHQKRVLECKIDFDFSGDEMDKLRLDINLEDLAKAENRLKVLSEKFAEYESKRDAPEIVRWALSA